jgi:hypothetical protein
MKPDTIKAPIAVDRLATADEIHAALLPFPDSIDECAAELLCEIASDLGGYVRIPVVEFETSMLVEEMIREGERWPN